MKILNLIIKQRYFDEILAGTKKEEYREVRPTTLKKYLKYCVKGQLFDSLDDVPDSLFNDDDSLTFGLEPIDYEALRLYVGYAKDRDSMLVEVKGIVFEEFVDEKGDVMTYEHKGNVYPVAQMVYELGEVLEKQVKPRK